MHFNKTVHPADFENLSSSDFERLVFAFLCRRWSWESLDWYGQLGDDGGRDIIGVREDQYGGRETVVVACANWRRLTAEKACGDLDKIAGGAKPLPRVMIIAGGKVSADLKGKVASHARAVGIWSVEVWSGPEFEEQLRAYAETVAARFFSGEELPDEAGALRAFVATVPANEQEGLKLIARLFDRPAFQTHFAEESSLPAFAQALSNTIEALNTGLWRTRDGAIIGRVPSKNDFSKPETCAALRKAAEGIVELRRAFDEFQRRGLVRPCGCGKPECPTVMIDPVAAHAMNRLRLELLSELKLAVPELEVAARLHP